MSCSCRELRGPARMLLLAALLLAFVLGVSVGTAYGSQDRAPEPYRSEVEATLDCLDLHVTPKIMLPMTRTTIRVETRIRRHAHHRQASVAIDGGLAGGGGSSWQLRGEESDFLHVREFREKVAAPWLIVAAVFDERGKLTGRREARIVMPERD